MRVFIIAAVCRVELAHPAADRDAENGDRMDERLVEETPFFLLYRVRGKRKERSFQFFHKRRIIRPRESNDFLVPQILVNIRRINPLRGNRLQITGHHFQICPRMFHGLLHDFLPQKLLILRDRRVQISHPEILRQQPGISRFHLKLRRLIGAEIRIFQHSRKLVERLADRELAA